MKNLVVLGSRGIPNNHGGFETFCEELALYFNKKYNVIVYCQILGKGDKVIKKWKNITLINIYTKSFSAKQTIIFDFKSVIHSLQFDGIFLVLGYNTAIFNIIHRFFNKKIIFNMDGMEWKRKKWNFLQKVWLYINQYIAILISNIIIADHPLIYNYFLSRTSESKLLTIPYGAHIYKFRNNKNNYSSNKTKYYLVLARVEPENQIYEILQAFLNSNKKYSIFIVGTIDINNEYHKKILNISSSSKKIHFLGPVYNKKKLYFLRKNSLLYIHGHTVGGTNPSLVEAMASGCAIVAHDNVFNRGVLGSKGLYFKNTNDLKLIFENYSTQEKSIEDLRRHCFNRYKKMFTWELVLKEYEKLFKKF